MTLVELVVVIALLGLAATLSGLAIQSLSPPARSPVEESLARARRDAVTRGESVRLIIDTVEGQAPRTVLFLPDGRILGNE
jgi:type II secretory pathway pseudopilin PulG